MPRADSDSRDPCAPRRHDTPEAAARALAKHRGLVMAPGGILRDPSGALVARGWRRFAESALAAGELLQDGEGYVLASEAAPALVAVAEQLHLEPERPAVAELVEQGPVLEQEQDPVDGSGRLQVAVAASVPSDPGTDASTAPVELLQDPAVLARLPDAVVAVHEAPARLIINAALHTGLRPAELRGLTWAALAPALIAVPADPAERRQRSIPATRRRGRRPLRRRITTPPALPAVPPIPPKLRPVRERRGVVVDHGPRPHHGPLLALLQRHREGVARPAFLLDGSLDRLQRCA